MNSKAEFSTQNLLDCWTILYQNLSKTLLKRHGKDGEIVIRKANYKCGKSAGNLQKVQMQNSGHPVNLKELFQFCCSEKMDPRFRIQWQILDEEEAVFDVVTCPLYDLFSEQNDPVSFLPFCEEFHAGYINGYTEGIGQCFLIPEKTAAGLGAIFVLPTLRQSAVTPVLRRITKAKRRFLQNITAAPARSSITLTWRRFL